MQDLLIAMRSRWYALELELLIPALLTDNDFRIVLAARADHIDRAFRERLPMTVAQFKPAAQKDIMTLAHEIAPNKINSYDQRNKYNDLFRRDIIEINKIFFDTEVRYNDGSLGCFRHSQNAKLHADTSIDHSPVYIARIGALPTWYISGHNQLNASNEIQQLINRSRQKNDESAREQLRDMGILTKLPLGDVAMILGSPSRSEAEGTLHCSSPVPPEGMDSAIFRIWARFRLG